MSTNLLLLDCDSTLSSIEGIDELARACGPSVFAQVEAMTHDAMNGKIAVEAVFGHRLEIIQPTKEQVAVVGQRYIDTVEPTAAAMLTDIKAKGWTPIILSGGFRQAIRPLADFLGIERVEAVDLFFDEAGGFRDFDRSYPTTRSGGKPEVIRRLRRELSPSRVVMVGDGVSDLETKPVVELFVGFGRYIAREPVRLGASLFVDSLGVIPSLLPR